MRTYYSSADILVTSDQVAVLRPYETHYRIDFLHDAYIVRHPPHPIRPLLEIRARYGSDDVRLFCTTDPRTFGQVRRALIRALEHRDAMRAPAG